MSRYFRRSTKYNAPLNEKLSENQSGIHVSQIKEDLSIDRNIEKCLLGTAPQIYPKIYTTLPEHTKCNLTKPLCSKVSNVETQLSALKSYVSCKISSLHSKEVESISQSLKVTLKVFQERETKTNEILKQNMTFSRMSS